MSFPRVTVICLCYNQGKFVAESIDSVLAQTYPNIELIVVDDGSTDNSLAVISGYTAAHPGIKFIPLSDNVGNCSAFNHGLGQAEGEYIIDLAADDVLLPERVAMGVKTLMSAKENVGVNFCDAKLITENGQQLHVHSEKFPHETIPEGNVYKELIARFFICSPTMMFKRSVIDSLGGYDETLSYEDFDFWIRSSRSYEYCYTPLVLVNKRLVRNSMSQRQFRMLSPQLLSTFKVCKKIMALNRSPQEQSALAQRILYEIRVSLRLLHFPLAVKYLRLYFKNRLLRY